METTIKSRLPFQDKAGFCNVLLSGLGGDGANMAAKLLFQIGVEEYNYDGGYDAQYGSEKKGTPTCVTVRLCEFGTPMRQSGTTTAPHVLAVFHRQLIEPLGLYRGIQPGATVIVNTTVPQNETASSLVMELRDQLRLKSGRIILVDATQIAADTGSRLNMPIMTILAQTLGFDMEIVRSIVANKWPRKKEENLAALNRALDENIRIEFAEGDAFVPRPPAVVRKAIGYTNMLNGGAISALHHSTFNRNNILSGWGMVPELRTDSCHGCAICMTVCADPGALIWRDGHVIGIDPQFCKGCMRCVEVCKPTKLGRALASPVVEIS